jgi:transcriptional regulator of arginine metabolism
MTKSTRLDLVEKVIKNHKIPDQSSLVKMLRDRNIDATQPSVSRDLQRLGAVKVNGYYQIPESLQPIQNIDDLVDIRFAAGEMLVIKTGPGGANRIGYIVDEAKIPGVAGTIAGEDTLFIALLRESRPEKVLLHVHKLLNVKREDHVQ